MTRKVTTTANIFVFFPLPAIRHYFPKIIIYHYVHFRFIMVTSRRLKSSTSLSRSNLVVCSLFDNKNVGIGEIKKVLVVTNDCYYTHYGWNNADKKRSVAYCFSCIFWIRNLSIEIVFHTNLINSISKVIHTVRHWMRRNNKSNNAVLPFIKLAT